MFFGIYLERGRKENKREKRKEKRKGNTSTKPKGPIFYFRKNSNGMQRQASKECSGLDATVECHVAFKKIKIWLDFCFFSSMEKKKENRK